MDQSGLLARIPKNIKLILLIVGLLLLPIIYFAANTQTNLFSRASTQSGFVVHKTDPQTGEYFDLIISTDLFKTVIENNISNKSNVSFKISGDNPRLVTTKTLFGSFRQFNTTSTTKPFNFVTEGSGIYTTYTSDNLLLDQDNSCIDLHSDPERTKYVATFCYKISYFNPPTITTNTVYSYFATTFFKTKYTGTKPAAILSMTTAFDKNSFKGIKVNYFSQDQDTSATLFKELDYDIQGFISGLSEKDQEKLCTINETLPEKYVRFGRSFWYEGGELIKLTEKSGYCSFKFKPTYFPGGWMNIWHRDMFLVEEKIPAGELDRVEINVPEINTVVSKNPINLSALGYGFKVGTTELTPIFSGATYEWGISSKNTIGTLKPNGEIAEFIPLNLGQGDLFVTARYNSKSVTKSIKVTVSDTGPIPSGTGPTKPCIPVPISPKGNITTKLPTLTWQGCPSTSSSPTYYKALISGGTIIGFNTLATSSTSYSLLYSGLTFQPGTTYSWRVKSCTDVLCRIGSDYSTSVSFIVVPQPTTISSTKPNLAVSAINSVNNWSGQDLKFTANYVNTGLTVPNGTLVRHQMWYDNQQIYSSLLTVQPTLNWKYSFNFNATVKKITIPYDTKTHTVKVCIDADNKLTESNEVDNCKTISFIPQTTPISGLVAWWKFNDNVSGNGKTVVDSSGNKNNALTEIGKNNTGINCTGTGKEGTACTFDGADDRIHGSSTLSFGTKSTITAWIKTSSGGAIFGSRGSTLANTLYLRTYRGKIQGVTDFSSSWPKNSVTSKKAINDNNWHHVAFVLDELNASIYVDGSLDNTATIVSKGAFTDNDWYMGYSDASWTSSYFKGQIDSLKIYNTALTSSQISEDMNSISK